MLLGQFADFMIMVLLAAALISLPLFVPLGLFAFFLNNYNY